MTVDDDDVVSRAGALEMILGLDHYIESACTKSACVLLKLGRPQFDRLMKRKFALPTIENLKENLASRLCLYIYQCPPNDAAFLKYLNMKLADASLMATLRKSKQVFDTNGVFQGAIVDKERSEARTELMKRLHMSADRAASLPPEDMSEVVVANMDKRLKLWSEKSNLNGGKLVRLQTAHVGSFVCLFIFIIPTLISSVLLTAFPRLLTGVTSARNTFLPID